MHLPSPACIGLSRPRSPSRHYIPNLIDPMMIAMLSLQGGATHLHVVEEDER